VVHGSDGIRLKALNRVNRAEAAAERGRHRPLPRRRGHRLAADGLVVREPARGWLAGLWGIAQKAAPPADTVLGMYSTNAYLIREATSADQDALRRLAELDSQRPLRGRVLIGEVDGVPAVAASLSDGRIVADPFRATAHLIPLVGMRARAQRTFEATPSLTERIGAAMSGWRPASPVRA
jgi:hypothetical protein